MSFPFADPGPKLLSLLVARSSTPWFKHSRSDVPTLIIQGDDGERSEEVQQQGRTEVPYRDSTDISTAHGADLRQPFVPEDDIYARREVDNSLTVQPARLHGEDSGWDR